MLWLDTHARSRKRLSPYIDGQLSPREGTRLEAHVAGCDACRRELDELRATISAVGRLPDAEPPRSFALTQRILEGRTATPAASVPPLANGMRLAGAGVAFVLAVVLVGDLGGVGGGGSRQDDGDASREAAEIQVSDVDNRDSALAPAPSASGAAENDAFAGEDEAAAGELSSSADKTEACAPAAAGRSGETQGAGGVGGPLTQEAKPAPEPAPTVSPVSPPEAVGATVDCAPAVADMLARDDESPLEALPDGDEGEVAGPAPEVVTSDDDGVSLLTVLEIILAGGLVALAGAIGIEYVMRRRAA